MPWNSIAPLGSISVKANRTRMQQNTTYTEVTMGNSIVGTNNNTVRDHFWNVGANEDGRHRFIQSPTYTSTAASPNNVFPVLGAGMNTMLVPILATGGSIEWFRKNVDSNDDQDNMNYQITPRYQIGVVNIQSASNWVNVKILPANVRGQITFFLDADYSRCQTGWFCTSATQCRGYSNLFLSNSGSTSTSRAAYLELRNDSSGDLVLRVRRGDAATQLNGIWHYRITYTGL